MSRPLRRAALALAVGIAAAPALAQFGGRRRGGGERGGRGADKGEDGGREPQINSFEVTLHEFHEDLKLSPEQEPAWQAYEDKVRALADDVSRERAQRASELNVLQRIDRVVDTARDRLTALEDIAESAKALYAKLSPGQQAAADPRLANVMAMPLALGAPRTPGARPSAPRGR